MLSLLACMAMTTGCSSDDDNWSPGAKAVNEYQVYFTSQSESAGEVDKGETVSFSVTARREDASKAASVPVSVAGGNDFEVPATIDFAEGESEKTFSVRFKGSEQTGDYACKLTIDDAAFSSPYTSLTTSVTLKLMVVSWEVVSESVHFYSYNNYTPAFDTQLLKLEGQETYRFKKFMANYDLTFTLEAFGSDGGYYIIPKGGFYAADWYDWGYSNCWHMGDDADNTWVLYYNGDDSGNYYTWCFFFSGAETGGSTYINFNKKTGCIMWDYSLYDSADNYLSGNWDYLMFDWK